MKFRNTKIIATTFLIAFLGLCALFGLTGLIYMLAQVFELSEGAEYAIFIGVIITGYFGWGLFEDFKEDKKAREREANHAEQMQWDAKNLAEWEKWKNK